MTRVPFICGNWKMHMTVPEALALVDDVIARVASLDGVEVGVAPPFTALHAVSKRVAGTKVRLAAQNVHFEAKGAYTGEISVPMLKDVGCQYAIVGHSERRQYFGETDAACASKLAALHAGGLRAIYCVGETLEERDGGKALEVVTRQLLGGLASLEPDAVAEQVIAYEPVWAIGTGRTATPDQAQEVHEHLRAQLTQRYGAEIAGRMRIQYGGSMKPQNAKELLAQGDIDGGLIGGAALKAEEFAAICGAAG
jgi:triosephosphate isomerase